MQKAVFSMLRGIGNYVYGAPSITPTQRKRGKGEGVKGKGKRVKGWILQGMYLFGFPFPQMGLKPPHKMRSLTFYFLLLKILLQFLYPLPFSL